MKVSKYFCLFIFRKKYLYVFIDALTINTINIFDSINVILFLLFLTGAFIPIDIEGIIAGLNISLNLFSFIQLKLNGDYNFVSNYFDFGLKNSNLEKFGIKSDSTIANMISFFLSIIIIWILHLWIHNCIFSFK